MKRAAVRFGEDGRVGTGEGLDVSWSPRAVAWQSSFIGVLVVYYALGWSFGFLQAWIAAPGLVLFVLLGGWALWSVRRARTMGPVLRVRPEGLVVGAGAPLAWDRVVVVRVVRLRPWWVSVVFRHRLPVVAFVGDDPVTLPLLPAADGFRLPWAGWLALRQYGTRCVVVPRATTVSLAELLDAVRAHGVRVEDARPH
jgi:hypothetical protein